MTRQCESIDVFEVQTHVAPAVTVSQELGAAAHQDAQPGHAEEPQERACELVFTIFDAKVGGMQAEQAFVCVSVLGMHEEDPGLQPHIVPGVPGGAVEPQFTSAEKPCSNGAMIINEKLAFSHMVRKGGDHDLEPLQREPVQVLISIHSSAQPGRSGGHMLGQTIIPATFGTVEQARTCPLFDAQRNPIAQEAFIRLSLSFHDPNVGADGGGASGARNAPRGSEPAREQGAATATPPPMATLKPAPYDLPWDSEPPPEDGRDLWDILWAPAGQVNPVKQQSVSGQADQEPAPRVAAPAPAPVPQTQSVAAASVPPAQQNQRDPLAGSGQADLDSALANYEKSDGVLKRDKRPEKVEYRMTPKEGAIKAIKALSLHGWDVILVGVGNEHYALQVHDKLWELGIVGGMSTRMTGENIVFVQRSAEVKEVSRQLGAVMAVVDHDCETLLSVQNSVEAGCRCVLLHPTSSDRDKLRANQLQREKAEVEMSDKLLVLNGCIARLRVLEEELLQQGVDMSQSRGEPHAADGLPLVRELMQQYKSTEVEVVQFTRDVEAASKMTSVPILCCPRARHEMILANSRSNDAWTQVCEALGLDPAAVHVQNDKCWQLARPDAVPGAPFYPLNEAWHQRRARWGEMCDAGRPAAVSEAGVGIAVVCKESGAFAIESIEYGSPAFCSQMLHAGDLILSVDGIVLKDLLPQEANRLLSGPPGSPLTIGAAAPTSPNQVFYVYLTRRSMPLANRVGRGRLLLLIDEIFLVEDIAPPIQPMVLRVRVDGVRNLPASTSRVLYDAETFTRPQTASTSEAVFGLVKLSTFSPVQEEQIRRTKAAYMSSAAEWRFEGQALDLDLYDPMRQKMRVQIFREARQEHEAPASVGCVVMSTPDVVRATAGQNGVWWRLLSEDQHVIVGTNGRPSEVKLSAEIVSYGQAEAQVPVLPSMSKDQARVAEPVGVTMTMDDDFESLVGQTPAGQQKYGDELTLDLAAALYTSEDRFVVCGLQPGSIVAMVNIVPDRAGVDLRPPKVLAMMLKDQSLDSKSMLRFARTTKAIRDVSICNAFEQPGGRVAAQEPPAANQRLAPTAPTVVPHRVEEAATVEAREGLRTSAPVPAPATGPKGRAAALVSGLEQGQDRAQDPALRQMPAVVSLTFEDGAPGQLDDSAVVEQMRQETGKCMYVPTSFVEIGQIDEMHRMVDICIHPHNQLRKNESSAGGFYPGVQHTLASQLVSQVFDHAGANETPIRKMQVLKHVVWAQCIKEPGTAKTRDVVAGMMGTQPRQQAAAPSQTAPTRGPVLTSSPPPDDRVWVSDPTLGVVWEEKVDEQEKKYWINHKDTVVSKSCPAEHWPLPSGWEQRVDELRRLQFRHRSSNGWQFDHPCASALVYGVLVNGKSPVVVAFRGLAASRGWDNIEAIFFKQYPEYEGALNFDVDAASGYTTVYDLSTLPLPGEVVAIYNLDSEHPNVPPVEVPTLAPPKGDESFPLLMTNMVETMLMQYPAKSYILSRSLSAPQPPAGQDFIPILISSRTGPGKVMHRICHTAGPGATEAGFEPGWVLVHPEETPWTMTPAQLAERGLVFGSVGELLLGRQSEYLIRIDPGAELPTSRRGLHNGGMHTNGTAEPFRRVPQLLPPSKAPERASLPLPSVDRSVNGAPSMPKHASGTFTVTLRRSSDPNADGHAGIGVGMQQTKTPSVSPSRLALTLYSADQIADRMAWS